MKLVLLAFLILIPISAAATITGTIYDYSLKPVPGAVITINTTPEQTLVAKEGTYTLEVPAGTYLLSVSKASPQGLVEQDQVTFTVPGEGAFTYDLILFRQINEFEEPDINEDIIPHQSRTPHLPISIGIIILLAAAFIIMKKRRPKDEATSDDLKQQLLAHLKQQRRATQKDIRKAFPVSEAKMSLLLTELETEGTIKKIKKGRGNIIVYEKVN